MAKGIRDPSSHRTPEQIRKMDRGYNSRPEIIKNRSQQNQARAIMKKKVGEAALAGKDVAHKRSVISGGSNATSNLSVQTKKQNRGWERKKGSRP
jgi:hypothetical protein